MFEVGQKYLLKMVNKNTLTEEEMLSHVALVDNKAGIIKITCDTEGYDHKYFKIPYFEWLIYTGEIRLYDGV